MVTVLTHAPRLIFSNFPDAFVAARANTVKSVLPGAILKFASLQSGGLQYAFQNQNVFLNYTRTLYVSACCVYLLGMN
jgi:hypothetical protein